MTSFSLRQVKLRPGEQHREELEVEMSALDFGGQRYLPVPDKVPAAFEITRANTGTVFTLAFTVRLHGPCYRCLGDAVLELPIKAREYQDEKPEDEEMATEYVEGNMLDVSAWARDTIALSLPDKILCRPDCAGLCFVVRQEPERGAAHARGDGRRLALGGARSATRRDRLRVEFRAALHQDDIAPLAALLRDPLAGPDNAKAAAGVQCDRGVVAREDPCLDRPDAELVGLPDERFQESTTDAASPGAGRDIDRVLRDALIAGAARHRPERRPAHDLTVVVRDEPRFRQVRGIPLVPGRNGLLEGAHVQARFVDDRARGPILLTHRLDRHNKIVRVASMRSRKRRSWETTTRQPA